MCFFIYFNQSHKIRVPFQTLPIILLQNSYNLNILQRHAIYTYYLQQNKRYSKK